MGFREELERRIAKKRAEIITLTAKLRETQIYVEALEDTLRLVPNEGGGEVMEVATQGAPLREGSLVSRAKQALEQAGHPLHIADLLKAIDKPTDRDSRAALSGSLGAYVRRGEVFTRPAPNTFGLVGMKASGGAQPDLPPPNFGVDGVSDGSLPAVEDADTPF
jgi:hypothetical protein